MDISGFMSWFIGQVVNIFSFSFNLLDSITFGGTSLLKVLLVLSILVPLLAIVLTIAPNPNTSRVRGYKKGKRENKKGD